LDGLLRPDIVKATKALSGIQVGSQQDVVLGHVQDAVEKSLGQCTQVFANMSTIGRRYQLVTEWCGCNHYQRTFSGGLSVDENSSVISNTNKKVSWIYDYLELKALDGRKTVKENRKRNALRPAISSPANTALC